MSPQLKTSFQGSSGKLLGFLLIALGLLFLFRQWFHIDIGQWGWPFLIIVPGAALFVLGLATDTPINHPLLILGSMTIAVGVLLFYQNAWAWPVFAVAHCDALGGAGREEVVMGSTRQPTNRQWRIILRAVMGRLAVVVLLGRVSKGEGARVWEP